MIDRFKMYQVVEHDKFGFNQMEMEMFGNRAPADFVKFRLLSKCESHIYWMALHKSKNQIVVLYQIPREYQKHHFFTDIHHNEQYFNKLMRSH